jgi:hypothetical protein
MLVLHQHQIDGKQANKQLSVLLQTLELALPVLHPVADNFSTRSNRLYNIFGTPAETNT